MMTMLLMDELKNPGNISRDPEPEIHYAPHCRRCGATIPEPRCVVIQGVEMFHKRWCDPCIDVLAAAEEADAIARKAAAHEEMLETRWRECSEPIYRDTDPAKLPMGREKYLAIINHSFSAGSVIIVGKTGSGKTRVAFQLIRREIFLGRKVRVASASQFRTGLTESRRAGHDRYLQDLIYADVTFLDDLGQISGTDAATEAIHELLEKRTARRKDTVITTQDGARQLAGRFASPEAGEAICRRIKDYFTTYRV